MHKKENNLNDACANVNFRKALHMENHRNSSQCWPPYIHSILKYTYIVVFKNKMKKKFQFAIYINL